MSGSDNAVVGNRKMNASPSQMSMGVSEPAMVGENDIGRLPTFPLARYLPT